MMFEKVEEKLLREIRDELYDLNNEIRRQGEEITKAILSLRK